MRRYPRTGDFSTFLYRKCNTIATGGFPGDGGERFIRTLRRRIREDSSTAKVEKPSAHLLLRI